MSIDDGRLVPVGSGTSARWQAADVALLIGVAVLLLARLPSLPVRFFDPDELEHAHAAWNVSRGLVPYRDFFEHHTPGYYYLLAPFFRWFAVDRSFDGAMRFLSFARGLSLLMTALATALVFLAGRVSGGRRMGLLAALFFAGQPIVIQKTLELRPDVPALVFFVAGLWLLLRALGDGARKPLLSAFAGGVCLGGAVMCTQKMLFVLPGAFLGLAVWALARGKRALVSRGLAVLAAGVGVAAPCLLTWAVFALHGGGHQFILDNFLLNAKWKVRANRHLVATLESSAPIVALGLLGAYLAGRRRVRDRPRAAGDVLLLCTFAGLVAGIQVVPAAYRQYLLMPLTVACLLAARGLCFLIDVAKERLRARLLVLAVLPLQILPLVELASSATDHDPQQEARLRYVFEHTRPSDPVLDGWLGTAVFRPNPLHYFFMHSELLAMLSAQQKADYVAALESGRARPALIALDDELKALGPRFLDFVHARYVTDDGLFYRPAP